MPLPLWLSATIEIILTRQFATTPRRACMSGCLQGQDCGRQPPDSGVALCMAAVQGLPACRPVQTNLGTHAAPVLLTSFVRPAASSPLRSGRTAHVCAEFLPPFPRAVRERPKWPKGIPLRQSLRQHPSRRPARASAAARAGEGHPDSRRHSSPRTVLFTVVATGQIAPAPAGRQRGSVRLPDSPRCACHSTAWPWRAADVSRTTAGLA